MIRLLLFHFPLVEKIRFHDTKNSLVELPPRIPARLLFQSGPNGESPPIDEIEEISGVTIIQSGSCAVKFSGTPKVDPKQLIFQWAQSSMIEATITFPGCTKILREKLRFECHHFWRNKSWICCAEFDDTLSLVPPRLTIVGKQVAVEDIVELVKKLAGDEIFVDFNPLIFSGTRSTSSTIRDHIVGPEYRHISSIHVIPISILDVFGSGQDESVRLEMFKSVFPIEAKMNDIPKPVVDRLLSAVGPGVWFNLSPDGTADIRVSSSESDVQHMYGSVYACLTRTVNDSISCEWITRISGVKSKKTREIENRWNVLILHQSEREEVLIIGKDRTSRLLAQIDLVGVSMEFIESLPDSIFETLADTFDSLLSRRIGRASGTVIEKFESKTFIFGKVENRNYAKSLLAKIFDSSISFPAPPLWLDTCLRSTNGIEEECKCMLTVSSSTVTVSSINLSDRIKTSVKLLNEIHEFFHDKRDPKRRVPEMYAKTDMMYDENSLVLSDDRLDEIEQVAIALNIDLFPLPRIGKVVLVAMSEELKKCAELILAGNFDIHSLPQYTSTISPIDRAKDSIEHIATQLGCLVIDNFVVSASRFRIVLFSHVISSPDPERQLALVQSGWN